MAKNDQTKLLMEIRLGGNNFETIGGKTRSVQIFSQAIFQRLLELDATKSQISQIEVYLNDVITCSLQAAREQHSNNKERTKS